MIIHLVGLKECGLGTQSLGLGWPLSKFGTGLDQKRNCSSPHHLIVQACLSGSETENTTLHYTNSLYPPLLLVMGHLLLLLEFGTNMLQLTLQPMYYMTIHTNSSDSKKIIPKDSVLEMTQAQPNTTLLKKSTILSELRKNIYTALRNDKNSPNDCDTQKFIIQNHYPPGYKAIYYMVSANNPNNITHPMDIIATPSK